jgi:hypothetical protein
VVLFERIHQLRLEVRQSLEAFTRIGPLACLVAADIIAVELIRLASEVRCHSLSVVGTGPGDQTVTRYGKSVRLSASGFSPE